MNGLLNQLSNLQKPENTMLIKRAQQLDVVDAADERAAAAVRDFGLTEEQRRRLVIVQEPD